MNSLDRLAFIDLETTGLAPSRDRITEIGIVTVDAEGISQWATLINPARKVSDNTRIFNGITNEALKNAPRFKDVASEIQDRLAGRLFIAHNARFDFGFLKAEFQRLGIEFASKVLCSVMLSRKLNPELLSHDLDTLIERHGLKCETRHRALPDAQALSQFWAVLQSNHPREKLINTIDELLAGPLLPPHLDSSLIDRLPEAPGVYLMYGENSEMLQLGKASSLKCHIVNYFRVDRASQKSIETSHRVRNITWRLTDGVIGAKLKLAELRRSVASPVKNGKTFFSWRLHPDKSPCIEIVALSQSEFKGGDHYGIFESEKKARNALFRIALKKNLCLTLVGLTGTATMCVACNSEAEKTCAQKSGRLRELAKIITALLPDKVACWPYQGPVGVRERRDLHIINEWRYLGTARTESEIDGILTSRPHEFEEQTFSFLARTFSRLPGRRIVPLPLLDLWRNR